MKQAEKQMGTRERSLHVLVEKWFGTGAVTFARVTQFNHSRKKPLRCVCVEMARPSGALEIMFFRHDDGSWCVFPPECDRPSMSCAHASGSPGVSVHYGMQQMSVA